MKLAYFSMSQCRALALISVALGVLPVATADSCRTCEHDAVKIDFKRESLPIALSGFFPYVQGGSGPARKYTTETWTGAGNAVYPGCGCFTGFTNIQWSGVWTFSTSDFSDTSTKLVTYHSDGCSGPGEGYMPNLKVGLGDGTSIASPGATSTEITTRNFIATTLPQFSCTFGYFFYNTAVTETLSGEFTLVEAKARAEALKTVTTGGADGLQFWNQNSPSTEAQAALLSRTAPINCYAQRVSFSATFAFTQPGAYQVTYRYKKWGQGSPEPEEVTDVITEDVEFKELPFRVPASGTEYKPYPFELKQGEQCKLVSVTAQQGCESGEPGTSSIKMESVHVDISLGKRPNSRFGAGSLQLHADTLTSALYDPSALLFAASTNPDVSAAYENGKLRQINAPQAVVDVVVLDVEAYEARFYSISQRGTLDEQSGVFAVSGDAFVTYKIENPDAGAGTATRLKITETRSTGSKVTLFEMAGTALEMSTGSGQRVERLDPATGIRTIRDSNGIVVSATKEVEFDFPFGKNIVQRVLDPAGAALATNYSYYDNPVTDGGSYGRLKQVVEPSGRWTRYSYDSQGRPAGNVSQFMNSVQGSVASSNRETVITYGELVDQDSDGVPEKIVTTTNALLGQETGRSYVVTFSKLDPVNGESTYLESSVTCIQAGAAWNDPSNLVTVRRLIASGALKERLVSELRPDNTLTVQTYEQNTGTLKVTTWTGASNPQKTAVVDGTKVEKVTNLWGHPVSSATWDISTALLLSSDVVTESDSFGRAIRIDYSDGTFETRSYACCGIESSTDRRGVLTTYGYDGLGHVISTSKFNQSTLIPVDPNGLPLSTSRQGTDGTIMRQETLTYDLSGRLISRKDALNRVTSYTEVKNGSGLTVKTATHPDGGTSVETYASDGSLLSITGTAVQQQLSYEYGVESDGAFVKEVHVGSAGQLTEWTKTFTDVAGRNYKIVYADGSVVQTFFDALGRKTKEIDQDGVTTLVSYGPKGDPEVTAVDVNRDGIIDYNGSDRIVTRVSQVAQSHNYVVFQTTTSVYATEGESTAQTVSVEETSMDGLHSWTTEHGLVSATEISYPGVGVREERLIGPDGLETVRSYSNERLVSNIVEHSSIGVIASMVYGYDAHGRLESATDVRTGATTFTYYADDQIQGVTSPDPDVNRSGEGYDPQTTSYSYDSAGRRTITNHPDGTSSTNEYFPSGLLKKTFGSRVYPQQYTYDSQGRIKTLTTWKNYAANTGQAVTTWNYDPARGWLTSKIYADSKGTSYGYWPSGRLKTRTWARGIVTTYGYDNAGSLDEMVYSDGTPSVAFSYNRLGQKSSRSDAGGESLFTYHASGQLASETYDGLGIVPAQTTTRGFDALNRLESLSNSLVSPVTYGYDSASRLDTVESGSTTAVYGYLPNTNLVASVTISQNGAMVVAATRSYDKLDRLTSITATPSADAIISSQYDFNAANQRTKQTDVSGEYWQYTYDALGQVASARKRLSDGTVKLGYDYAFEIDDIGNRESTTTNGRVAGYTTNTTNAYDDRAVPSAIDVIGTSSLDAAVTVNGQNAQRQGEGFYLSIGAANTIMSSWTTLSIEGVPSSNPELVSTTERSSFLAKNPEVFTYDFDGNLLTDGRWSYVWDAENRLIAMETRAAIVSPVGTFPRSERRKLEFSYDGQGRRIQKKVYAWTGGTSWTVVEDLRFSYDGFNLLAETRSSGQLLRAYLWGLDLSGSAQGAGGVGGALSMSTATGAHAYVFDANGNVIALVEQLTGTQSARYDYNAFGETVVSDGITAWANPFRFSTKYSDEESGLYYYGFRYYDSSLGRWLSRDPLGELGGLNLYGMVNNDSVNSWDYLGLADCSAEKSRYESQRNAVDNLQKKINNLMAAIERGVRNILNNEKMGRPALPMDHQDGMSNADSVAGHVDELARYADALARNRKQLEQQQKWLDAAQKAYAECLEQVRKECAEKSDFHVKMANAAGVGENISKGVAIGSLTVGVGIGAYLSGGLLFPAMSIPALAY